MHGVSAYEPHFQNIRFPSGNGCFVDIRVLREDLAHPDGQGNKYWKLKYNLAGALRTGQTRLLTFGGAYSNHIHAVAAAGRQAGLQTIGVIRGEAPEHPGPTLRFAAAQGMRLHFVTREAYRQKNEPRFLETLRGIFGDFFHVPEGGSNSFGLSGCEEWGTRLAGHADIYALAAGTAVTAAGLAKALALRQPGAEVWAFSALKNGEFLKTEAENIAGMPLPRLRIVTEYHFGGYARHTPALLDFIRQTETAHGLPLEQVYTAKALYGLLGLARQGSVPAGARLCFIHTGGMQGRMPGLTNTGG